MKSTVNRQDPNFREKVQDLERLSKLRINFYRKVYKLLVDTIKSGDYQLQNCSYQDNMESAFNSPSREFRFTFILREEESEEEE